MFQGFKDDDRLLAERPEVKQIENDKTEAGSILQEIQSGYMLGERLLRPALVSVAKKKITKNGEKNKKKEEK